MFPGALEEAFDGTALLAAVAVVFQGPFGRFRGRLGQSRPLRKRAGPVHERAPAFDMERNVVPGRHLFDDRPAHGEPPRPDIVVAAELLEPDNAGGDFLHLVRRRIAT